MRWKKVNQHRTARSGGTGYHVNVIAIRTHNLNTRLELNTRLLPFQLTIELPIKFVPAGINMEEVI
jgi:hypothetical protein